MGCCYSGETEATDQSNLIQHPNPDSKPINGMEQNPAGPQSCPNDEQALLSSILTKTALNIIDVSASDSQGMEQHEYMDKSRQYRLAVVGDGLSQKKPAALSSLTNQPHKVLASDLVSHLDLQQVSKIAAYAHSAISKIKVDAKEDLVVQFAIP
ncbi:hypothetical protein SKAU_G00264240 [Synaphobranchus kaupii]|uniref:Ragulator complex protein LAMTOR1 n=1 Tax=Synaphobranchus kaupii TaxID=118154 RepID=A0A9Q1IP04_SYNKA|nr:hypothetical protein SKAU_G00264240 [Synaphobranchus kaupii]